jgi:hypothetical protein
MIQLFAPHTSAHSILPTRQIGGSARGYLGRWRASQSRIAYWMVVRSVYSCVVTLGVNILICRWEREEASRTRDAGEAVLAAIEPISGVRSPSNC